MLEGGEILLVDASSQEAKYMIEQYRDEVNEKYASTKWQPIVLIDGMPSQPQLEPFYREKNYMKSFGIGNTKYEL